MISLQNNLKSLAHSEFGGRSESCGSGVSALMSSLIQSLSYANCLQKALLLFYPQITPELTALTCVCSPGDYTTLNFLDCFYLFGFIRRVVFAEAGFLFIGTSFGKIS